jgi:hypothetical protein
VLGSLIRLGILLSNNFTSGWYKWIECPAFRSIVVDEAFSMQTLEEAIAVRKLFAPHGFVDAYRGNQIPIPPLLLVALQSLLTTPSEYWQSLSIGTLLLVVDFVIAGTLEQIGRSVIARERVWEEQLEKDMPSKLLPPLSHIFETAGFSKMDAGDPEPTFTFDSLPFVISQLYYLSPMTLFSGSVLHCFQNLPVLCLLSAISHACRGSGSVVWSAFYLSMASYMNLHCVLFLFPVTLLFGERGKSIPMFCILYAVLSISFQILEFLLVGEKEYGDVFLSTHAATFRLTGMAPSLSTLWYLGMELFDRFTGYFTVFLAGLPYVLVVPTTIRLHRYPEALVSCWQSKGCVRCCMDSLDIL